MRAVGVSVPMRCIRCTHNTRGGTDWNGGTKGGLERHVAGHSGDGHGDCELWINCHRVFDLWCLCRLVALCRFALSFFFFTFPGWCDLFLLPLLFQGDPSLFGRHPFLLFFLRFAFVWLIVLDRARFQRAAFPSLSFSFFYNNDFLHTNIFLSFASFFLSLFTSSLFLFVSLSNDSANNGINVRRLAANVSFRFSSLSVFRRKLTTPLDTADVGIIRMSATTRFGYKNFSICRSTAAAVDWERRCNKRMLYN